MTKTTALSNPRLAASTAGPNDPRISTATRGVSLPRLNVLRFGYLLMAVWLVLTKWPPILNHDVPWPPLDPATVKVFTSCLVVLIVLAVVPWRHVVAQYVTKPGDRWRSAGTRPVSDGL